MKAKTKGSAVEPAPRRLLLREVTSFTKPKTPNRLTAMFLRQISDPHLAQNACVIGCQRTGEAIALRTRLPAPVLQKAFVAGRWIVATYVLARNLPGFPKI